MKRSRQRSTTWPPKPSNPGHRSSLDPIRPGATHPPQRNPGARGRQDNGAQSPLDLIGGGAGSHPLIVQHTAIDIHLSGGDLGKRQHLAAKRQRKWWLFVETCGWLAVSDGDAASVARMKRSGIRGFNNVRPQRIATETSRMTSSAIEELSRCAFRATSCAVRNSRCAASQAHGARARKLSDPTGLDSVGDRLCCQGCAARA